MIVSLLSVFSGCFFSNGHAKSHQPVVFLGLWSASYYQPQSIDVVKSLADRRHAKGLSYWALSSFQAQSDSSFIAWMNSYRPAIVNSSDYRVAYSSGNGWFLVNRFGFAVHGGLPTAFDVGKFIKRFHPEDQLHVIVDNRTSSPFQLFASNGLAIGVVKAHSRLRWQDGWTTGIFARQGGNRFGVLEDPSLEGGTYQNLPRMPAVSVTQSTNWNSQTLTMTLTDSAPGQKRPNVEFIGGSVND